MRGCDPTSCRRFPASSNVNNFDTGNSTATRILNTAGYRFNQTDLNNRDQYGVRGDYSLTDKHRFEGIYSYFKETDDRTDLDFISPDCPLVFTNCHGQAFLSGMAVARQRKFPERGTRRRQPRAGAVQQQLAVPGHSSTTRRSASSIRLAETVPRLQEAAPRRHFNPRAAIRTLTRSATRHP